MKKTIVLAAGFLSFKRRASFCFRLPARILAVCQRRASFMITGGIPTATLLLPARSGRQSGGSNHWRHDGNVSVSEARSMVISPAPLANGDHQVSFASQGSTVAFTLTIGGKCRPEWRAGRATTPVVGNFAPTKFFSIGRFILLTSSSLLLWAKKKKNLSKKVLPSKF